MKCPRCGHPVGVASAPAWRSISDGHAPPLKVEVEVYSTSARRWGRGTWTGLRWLVRDESPLYHVTHFYECVPEK